MKVVIDILPLHTGHKTRGIGTYTRELSRALRQADKANAYILTTRPREITNISLVHYPYFDLFFHTLPLKKTTRTVVTIHDVIPLIFPRWFRPGIRGRFRFWLQALALRKVDAIITDSHNSREDIVKYLKIDPQKIHVIPLAAAAEFSHPLSSRQLSKIRTKYNLPGQYLLYVGDINPHKNLPRLLEAFKSVSSAHPALGLVLVSRALSQPIREAKQLKDLITRLNLTKSVKLLTTVPFDPLKNLVGIYSLSSAYVHPSLYEGFGLPVLEALTVGTPVVCSAVASLPEVYGESALTFDPSNTASLTAALNRLLDMTLSQKDYLITTGKDQASHFSWHQTALRTIAVYQELIHG